MMAISTPRGLLALIAASLGLLSLTLAVLCTSSLAASNVDVVSSVCAAPSSEHVNLAAGPASSSVAGMNASSGNCERDARRLSPYDVSIIEARGVPSEFVVPWLLPPREVYLPGLLVADLELLRELEVFGTATRILGEYLETELYYVVQSPPLVSERTVAQLGEVLWCAGDSYLISSDDEIGDEASALGFRLKVLYPVQRSLVSITPVSSQPFRTSSLVEDFWTDWMVGAVSETDILNYLNILSGEEEVNLAGGPDTLLTRYSFHPGCRKAAEYIYGQFDGMGIDVTYDDYFGIPLWCITFEGLEGYAVGKGGTILHTEDGGDSWEKQNSATDQILLKACFIDADSGWVSGAVGVCLRTFDGGSTWDSLVTGTWFYLYGVEFLNALEGWTCGAEGTVRKSTDGGLSWFAQTSGTSERLYDIEFVDAQTGWAVGTSGKIIHTSDGGENWAAQTSGVSQRLHDLCFVDVLKGWVVGYSGTILYTTDGGSTWEAQSSGVLQSLQGVCFTDSLHGWVVGYDGVMLHTDDGGEHWNAQDSRTGSRFFSVSFIDSLRGWAAGTSSIIRTENGGDTWCSLNENVPDKWRNVIATLDGNATPSEIYIVCGHYDSISDDPTRRAPGADDNATGTSLVLEAASILKDFPFSSSIRFVCFSGEEQGLIGSNHYAADVYAAGHNIAGVLNFDMVGYGTPIAYLIGNSASEWLVDYCVAVRDSFIPSLGLTKQINPSMRWSDHASFWDKGYSALCGIETDYMTNPYYHSTGDTVGNLTIPFVAAVTKLAVASLASLAELDTSGLTVPPGAGVPSVISLGRNYPNPFNPCTYIPFVLPVTSEPTNYVLAIFDPAGRMVKILEEGRTRKAPLERTVIWDGTDESGAHVASGVYICSLRCGRGSRAQKVVLIR